MKKIGTAAAAILLLFIAPFASAGEHPSEHPAGERSEVTVETIAQAIYAHVTKESRKGGGWFRVEDKEAKKGLSLKLDKIHKERLSAVGNGRYFACVDFTADSGQTYDVDFFLKDSDMGLAVTETLVHKEGGKPRYNWEKKGDYWVQVPAN